MIRLNSKIFAEIKKTHIFIFRSQNACKEAAQDDIERSLKTLFNNLVKIVSFAQLLKSIMIHKK